MIQYMTKISITC